MATVDSWRPPQWSKPAMVSITAPASVTSGTSSVNTVAGAQATTFVFDAVFDLEHMQRVEKTRHPVQTGSDISTHAYIMPAELVLYVGMSDVMSSYATGQGTAQPAVGGSSSSAVTAASASPWTGNASKSVAAYTQMIALQTARQPLIVVTRLRTYRNMIILAVSPREDFKTITGLRMRVEFGQIFVASTQNVPISARPNDTNQTGLGAVNTQPPNTTVVNQFQINGQPNAGSLDPQTNNLMNWLRTNPQGVKVPGAGDYSSTNTNNLQQLPAPQ